MIDYRPPPRRRSLPKGRVLAVLSCMMAFVSFPLLPWLALVFTPSYVVRATLPGVAIAAIIVAPALTAILLGALAIHRVPASERRHSVWASAALTGTLVGVINVVVACAAWYVFRDLSWEDKFSLNAVVYSSPYGHYRQNGAGLHRDDLP